MFNEIGGDQDPFRLQDTVYFRQGFLWSGYNMQCIGNDGRVKRMVLIGKLCRVRYFKGKVIRTDAFFSFPYHPF